MVTGHPGDDRASRGISAAERVILGDDLRTKSGKPSMHTSQRRRSADKIVIVGRSCSLEAGRGMDHCTARPRTCAAGCGGRTSRSLERGGRFRGEERS